MKIKFVCIFLFLIYYNVFSVDINNTICFIGFKSSNDDPILNELVTKANEIIVDNFTIAGNVSLINFIDTDTSNNDSLNPINQYPYIIYGTIESSNENYNIEIYIKDNNKESISKHYKSANSVLDVFPICDELYKEITPDFSEIIVSNKKTPSTTSDFSIDTINSYKIHEWLFNGSTKSEISKDTFWTGKFKYTRNRKNEDNSAVKFDTFSTINKINNGYDLYNDFTISIWILLNNRSLDSYGRIYDCMQWNHKTGYNIICHGKLHCIDFSYFGEDGITHDAMTNEKLYPGKWYNVIVTFKDGTSCMYLNGKLQQINSSTHTIKTSKRYISIGNGNDDNTRWPFYGELDDLMIFNKALTQQEVSILYQTF